MGNDLTKGPIARTLIRFTTPYLIANLLNTLYGIVDMFIVGRFASSMELGAVSIGAMIMMMVNFLIMGLATGGTVLVGNLIGAKREKEVRETTETLFCLLPLVSIVLMVVFYLCRVPLLKLIHTPAESFEGAEAYLSICLVGLLFTGFYNAISSVFRGMGESKTPMIFVGISCVLNIFGDILCVGGLGMGAAGAATSTTVSQAIAVVIGYVYIKRRGNFPFDFRPSSFRIAKDKAKRVLALGIPAAAQETLISLSFIVLEAIINRMGYIATAAAGVDDRIFNIAVIPATAFSGAIAAMVAQNNGAGMPERSHRCLLVGAAWSGVIGVILFAVMAIVPGFVIGLFTPDKQVVDAGVQYMTFCKYEYIICAVAFCINGYINGVGRTRYTMTINIISSIAIRLPLVYMMSLIPGATLWHVGFGLPVASFVQLVLAVAFLLFAKSEREYRKMRKVA